MCSIMTLPSVCITLYPTRSMRLWVSPIDIYAQKHYSSWHFPSISPAGSLPSTCGVGTLRDFVGPGIFCWAPDKGAGRAAGQQP